MAHVRGCDADSKLAVFSIQRTEPPWMVPHELDDIGLVPRREIQAYCQSRAEGYFSQCMVKDERVRLERSRNKDDRTGTSVGAYRHVCLSGSLWNREGHPPADHQNFTCHRLDLPLSNQQFLLQRCRQTRGDHGQRRGWNAGGVDGDLTGYSPHDRSPTNLLDSLSTPAHFRVGPCLAGPQFKFFAATCTEYLSKLNPIRLL